jgi:hypothetical protein
MRPALDPTGHRVPRTKPTCLLHSWRPHRQRPFALVLHLHQHESSRNLHLQYLAKNQSTQRCQSLITQGSDHPLALEPHMVLKGCPTWSPCFSTAARQRAPIIECMLHRHRAREGARRRACAWPTPPDAESVLCRQVRPTSCWCSTRYVAPDAAVLVLLSATTVHVTVNRLRCIHARRARKVADERDERGER